MNDKIKNILSFGGHNRIKKEEESFNKILRELEELNDKHENKKSKLNAQLLEIAEIKKEAIISLKKMRKIIKHLNFKDRENVKIQVEAKNEKINLSKIETTIDLGLEAIKLSKGVSAGLATASTTSFLVGNFAAASTGTAISSLSGAAATNATLAWLGGGSIAAGGGGIAAGTIVMGGLVTIPALTVMGLLSHLSANKQIKKIKEKENEALKAIDVINNNLLNFNLLEKRTNEIKNSIQKTNDVFNFEFIKTYNKLYPIPFISKLFKQIKKVFRLKYYSKKDMKHISYIGKIATDFAKIIDTDVIKEINLLGEI